MTVLRILATTDLGTAVVPMRTSYGESGTVHGMVELLERARARRPTIWLDVGDLTVGPAMALLDHRPWEELARLPIACTAAGNHDFDDGLDALHDGVRSLSYPMLCANADAGLPPSALLETPAGPLGAIGLAHPDGHLIIGGHNFGAWTGELAGTPAGEANVFAASALVVDLLEPPARPIVRGVVRVPPSRPPAGTPVTEAFDAAAGKVVGTSPERWITRTGARRYLPELIAEAFRTTSGADAAFVPPAHHGAQDHRVNCTTNLLSDGVPAAVWHATST